MGLEIDAIIEYCVKFNVRSTYVHLKIALILSWGTMAECIDGISSFSTLLLLLLYALKADTLKNRLTLTKQVFNLNYFTRILPSSTFQIEHRGQP
jgi:hypothetical protein